MTENVDGRDKRAFTPVFDRLCPAMTTKLFSSNVKRSMTIYSSVRR